MTHTTAHVLPAHWPEEVKAAFWTAVNAPTTVQAAAATLAFAERLAAPVSSPADPTGLRDRIAGALYVHDHPNHLVPLNETGMERAYRESADAVLAVLPPPANRAVVCICGHPEHQHFEDVCITEITGCQCGAFLLPEAAAEVIDRWRQAAIQARADRAAVLREAADRLAEEIQRGARFSHEDARQPGLCEAVELLRRMAAETSPVRHAPGTAILCPDCRAKGHSICVSDADEAQQQPDTDQLVCVCGAPTVRDGERWTHHPGTGEACLYRPNARPRCPECQMPHDLTPGMALVCASIRASIAEQLAINPRRVAAEEQPTQTPAVAVRTLAAALDGIHTLIATSSRDWGTYRVDAWLWAVLCGWDCGEAHEHDELCDDGAAMREMAERHGWDEAAVAKARRYRAAVRALTEGAARPVVGEQPDTRQTDRIVAYRNPALTELHCLRCTPHPAGDIWTPVTAGELEDGGICAVCGVDVLIPQETPRG